MSFKEGWTLVRHFALGVAIWFLLSSIPHLTLLWGPPQTSKLGDAIERIYFFGLGTMATVQCAKRRGDR